MQYYAYYWEIWFSVSVGRSVSTKNLLDYEVQTMSDSELIQRMHPYVIQSLDSRYFDHFRATTPRTLYSAFRYPSLVKWMYILGCYEYESVGKFVVCQ